VFTPIAGGTTKQDIETGRVANLARQDFPQRTTLMKVATVSTLWDYINRAMPWTNPKTLTVEEVYATVAFILNLGDIVDDDFVLSDKNIADVQKRMPNRNGMGGGSAPHPFQLQVTGNSLSVGFGSLDIARVLVDEDNKPFLCMERAGVAVGAGGLNGGPNNDVGGTLSLTSNVLYGVWFEFLWASSGTFDKTAGISGEFVTWDSQSFSLGVEIVASSTFTTSAAASIMAANSVRSYMFIGTVQTDGTTPVIKQHIRSDVQIPMFALPNKIISADSGPELTTGADGGISYEP
jgi:hypothetical protein